MLPRLLILMHLKPTNNRFLKTQTRIAACATILFTCLLLPAYNAHAQTPQDKVLTLVQAIDRTLQYNLNLKTFAYTLREQDARITQAGLSPLPEIRMEVEDLLGSGEYKGVDSAQATLSISWVSERRQRHRRVDVARETKTVLEIEQDINRLDAAAQTAQLYLSALSNQAQIAIEKDAVSLAKNTAQAIKKRVNAGKAPQAELLRARTDLAKRRLRLMDAEHALAASKRELVAQWGADTVRFSQLQGDLITQPILLSFTELNARITENPDITRYLSEQRLNESQITLAQAQRQPGWRWNTGLRRIERSGDTALVVGVAIPWAGANANRGAIAQAQARADKTRAQAQAVTLQMQTRLFVLYQELLHSQHVLDALNTQIIPSVREALKQTRRAYELGRYSYLEWQSVQNELLEAQSAVLQASVAAHRNAIEIERLTGARLSPADATQPGVSQPQLSHPMTHQ